MRRFRDAEGREWEATIGRESWGMLVLLFSDREGAEVRRAALASETVQDANRELDAMDEEELRRRLRDAEPWGEGTT